VILVSELKPDAFVSDHHLKGLSYAKKENKKVPAKPEHFSIK